MGRYEESAKFHPRTGTSRLRCAAQLRRRCALGAQCGNCSLVLNCAPRELRALRKGHLEIFCVDMALP
eukprot:15484745-Alexandrium_andersonii.AAC.1